MSKQQPSSSSSVSLPANYVSILDLQQRWLKQQQQQQQQQQTHQRKEIGLPSSQQTQQTQQQQQQQVLKEPAKPRRAFRGRGYQWVKSGNKVVGVVEMEEKMGGKWGEYRKVEGRGNSVVHAGGGVGEGKVRALSEVEVEVEGSEGGSEKGDRKKKKKKNRKKGKWGIKGRANSESGVVEVEVEVEVEGGEKGGNLGVMVEERGEGVERGKGEGKGGNLGVMVEKRGPGSGGGGGGGGDGRGKEVGLEEGKEGDEKGGNLGVMVEKRGSESDGGGGGDGRGKEGGLEEERGKGGNLGVMQEKGGMVVSGNEVGKESKEKWRKLGLVEGKWGFRRRGGGGGRGRGRGTGERKRDSEIGEGVEKWRKMELVLEKGDVVVGGGVGKERLSGEVVNQVVEGDRGEERGNGEGNGGSEFGVLGEDGLEKWRKVGLVKEKGIVEVGDCGKERPGSEFKKLVVEDRCDEQRENDSIGGDEGKREVIGSDCGEESGNGRGGGGGEGAGWMVVGMEKEDSDNVVVELVSEGGYDDERENKRSGPGGEGVRRKVVGDTTNMIGRRFEKMSVSRMGWRDRRPDNGFVGRRGTNRRFGRWSSEEEKMGRESGLMWVKKGKGIQEQNQNLVGDCCGN